MGAAGAIINFFFLSYVLSFPHFSAEQDGRGGIMISSLLLRVVSPHDFSCAIRILSYTYSRTRTPLTCRSTCSYDNSAHCSVFNYFVGLWVTRRRKQWKGLTTMPKLFSRWLRRKEIGGNGEGRKSRLFCLDGAGNGRLRYQKERHWYHNSWRATRTQSIGPYFVAFMAIWTKN